jgi:hypothetical protein
VQWVFDRTAASGRATGQLLAVSLSHAVAEIASRSRRCASASCPRSSACCPAHGRGRARLRRDARAARHLPRGAGHTAAAPARTRTPLTASTSRARGPTPVAGDDGGRRPQRPRRGNARARDARREQWRLA